MLPYKLIVLLTRHIHWYTYVSISDFLLVDLLLLFHIIIEQLSVQTDMDSTNLYAYISIIALIVCLPPAIILEGPVLLKHGFNDAIAKVGLVKFVTDLFWVGMFYHLYNQVNPSFQCYRREFQIS